MKVKTFSFLVAGLLLSVFNVVFAEPVAISTKDATMPPPIIVTSIPSVPVVNNAFTVGEMFVFNVNYEFMKAGEATLEIVPGEERNGKATWKIQTTAKSVGLVDTFYRVRDQNESIIEVDTLASLGLRQNLREGKFRVIRTSVIDYSSATWFYTREYKGKTNTMGGIVTKRVDDVLSSFYRTRTLPLELGQTYYIDIFAEDKTYPLRILVGEKTEKIKVMAGEFECLRVQPFLQGDGIFKGKDGNLIVYLTNDKRRMPVLMSSKVFIGSVDVELVRYRFNANEEFKGKK